MGVRPARNAKTTSRFCSGVNRAADIRATRARTPSPRQEASAEIALRVQHLTCPTQEAGKPKPCPVTRDVENGARPCQKEPRAEKVESNAVRWIGPGEAGVRDDDLG